LRELIAALDKHEAAQEQLQAKKKATPAGTAGVPASAAT
jgi:hypothetical protein